MRKYLCTILFCALLFNAMSAFADYGPWTSVIGIPNLQFRVKNAGSNPDAQGKPAFIWWVQLQNKYAQKVAFRYAVTEPGGTPVNWTDLILGAEQNTEQIGMTSWFIVKSKDTVDVSIKNFRFGDYPADDTTTASRQQPTTTPSKRQ